MPLEFRNRGGATQFAVMSGEVVIASLYKGKLAVTAGPAVVWNWSFRMTDGLQPHGITASFDEAKAMIEQEWARWLAAAGLWEI